MPILTLEAADILSPVEGLRAVLVLYSVIMKTPLLPLKITALLATLALSGFGADLSDDDAGIAYEQIGSLAMPAPLLFNGLHYAEVRVAISVDADGHLTDSLAIGYTDPTCAEAALAAVKKWTYQSARVHGQARAGRAEILFVFKADVVSVQTGTQDIQRSLSITGDERYVYSACQLSKLDRIPTPIQITKPVMGLDPHGPRKISVEFYIDEKGNVRMPTVSRDDAADTFAASAISAVEKWHFEPPLRRGRPVLVLATQDFITPKQKE